MKASNLKIGQILINSGAITEEQLEEVLKKQKTSKKAYRRYSRRRWYCYRAASL